MRIWVLICLAVAFFAETNLALGRVPDDCKPGDGDREMAACARLIEDRRASALDRSVAYSNRGVGYFIKRDFDHAIGDFTESIKLDLRTALWPFEFRAQAYAKKGDFDRAIGDYNSSIRINAEWDTAYRHLGDAYRAKGANDRAIADYTEAIRLNPSSHEAYRNRGVTYLLSGSLANALTDINKAAELDPKDPYNALWADIVGQRNNAPSRLTQITSKLDKTVWPAPIVRIFLGQATAKAALDATGRPNKGLRNLDTQRDRICEVNFYTGELALRRGATDEASRLFALAASDCSKTYDEWAAANAELKSLGAAPTGVPQ